MAGLNVILTGATGMVGEGVLFECLQNDKVSSVLMVNRRHYELQHSKLKELIVSDFLNLDSIVEQLRGYDACFFCAGVSSVGMNEETYTRITYDTTLLFAKTVLGQNPDMVFTYVSGSGTNSTEQGRLMWARVKGKTENDLLKLPFKAVYNFRPAVMLPFEGQQNWKPVYKYLARLIKMVVPKYVLTMQEVGQAMINAATAGYPTKVLEIPDIKALAKQQPVS
jgi:uncharacterized protein YbjT (DUF2867 family)